MDPRPALSDLLILYLTQSITAIHNAQEALSNDPLFTTQAGFLNSLQETANMVLSKVNTIFFLIMI